MKGILNMKWEVWFEDKILERGYDYFEENLVENFKIKGNKIIARVQGTEVYNVSITLKDNELSDAQCDCPYALKGNYCKHMAAVMYYFEANEQLPDKKAIEELIKMASNQQIHDFLLDLLSRNKHILNDFESVISNKESDDKFDFCQAVDTAIDTYSDSDGYIDYYGASDFGNEIALFLDEDVQKLVDNNQFEEAWTGISYLIDQLQSLNIDDSDGEIMSLCDQAQGILDQFIPLASKDLETKIYQWCRQTLLTGSDILEDFVVDLFVNNFQEKSFLEDKLEFSSLKLTQIQNSDIYYKDFKIDRWAGIHVAVMEQLNLPQDEIKDFYLDNLYSNKIRFLYADFCITHADYPTAIEVLEDGKSNSQAEGYPGQTIEYSKKLKDLYKKLGRNDEYLQELWLLETDYALGDSDIYQELEQQYSVDQWKVKREAIFKKVGDSSYSEIGKLYLADKLYDRLLNLVLKTSNSAYDLEKYEGVLKSRYPQQLLAGYVEIVESMSKRAGKRSHYREIVSILNHMLTYPDGLETTTKIVHELETKYPRRTAMLEEFQKVNL